MNISEFKTKRDKAIALATKAHYSLTNNGSPQFYDGQPYTAHLNAVEQVLMRFGVDPKNGERDQNLLIAAWLHDTLEDTKISREYLEIEIGKDIADLVFAVTNEKAKNRNEKFQKTFPKIKAHPYATTLKLADRIANTEASAALEKSGKNSFISMYRKEYTEFRSQLKTDQNSAMWNHLDYLTKE
jgi:(p)ppGpp synthase/HD superfamily hydrolase